MSTWTSPTSSTARRRRTHQGASRHIRKDTPRKPRDERRVGAGVGGGTSSERGVGGSPGGVAAGAGGGADGGRPAAGPHDAGLGSRLPARAGLCGLAVAGRGVRRAGSRVRPAQCRGRMAVLHPRGVRPRRGAVRARRAAGTVDSGGAGDARGGRLQAASEPGPGLGDPWRQRGRRDAHAGRPWADRGGRTGSRHNGDAVPHDRLLPGADRGHLTRGPAGPRAVSARAGRSRRPRTHWARGITGHPLQMNQSPADDQPDGLVRLQKLLAQSGVASRRKCEEMMLAGLVEVDGEVVTRLGTKVDPTQAVIRVQGKRLPPVSRNVYLALFKPRGVVSTMSDPEGRRTLSDLVADRPERLFHVGRLDTDTEGLILLTNDGDFAQRVAHPSYELDKTYVAEVDGVVSKATARRIRDGVSLEDGPVEGSSFRIVPTQVDRSIVELVIPEGRNRIVRRLLDEGRHPVRRLTRTVIGPVTLRGLRSGQLRELTRDELGVLLDAAAL